MEIEKKTWPEYFQDILDGKKKFDIRIADFACSPGDTLVLKEWDPKAKNYTGREIRKEVRYVLKTDELEFWSEKDIEKYGFQIISW